MEERGAVNSDRLFETDPNLNRTNATPPIAARIPATPAGPPVLDPTFAD